LKEINVDSKSEHVIPLAFDYSCVHKGCKKKWQSINSEKSKKIDKIIEDMIDKNNF